MLYKTSANGYAVVLSARIVNNRVKGRSRWIKKPTDHKSKDGNEWEWVNFDNYFEWVDVPLLNWLNKYKHLNKELK